MRSDLLAKGILLACWAASCGGGVRTGATSGAQRASGAGSGAAAGATSGAGMTSGASAGASVSGASAGAPVSGASTGAPATSGTSPVTRSDAGPSACGGFAIPMGTGGPSGGSVGVWTDVTPAGINPAYSGDNFGLQDVLVDPVRPSDLYEFVCHQGVWKSTDYGQTWVKIDTGANASVIDGGKPWSAGIDSNRCRDPSTPPTLYTLNGAGSQNGFWKSTDGGVNWARYAFPSNSGGQYAQDGYSIDVDPYDGQHIIVGFHEETGFVESKDGGQTWRVVTMAPGMAKGISWYGFFIDTGDPAATGSTWLLFPQDTGGVGTWRTTDAGATWTKVEGNEHPHGNAQIFQSGGAVYMAGDNGTMGSGVYRSTNAGATWTHVGTGAAQAIVYGTGKNVYAQYAWACGGCNLDQSKSEIAPLPGMVWTTLPFTMANGPKRAAVTHDGAHYIVVSGNWNAGIWRYVEP